jgi:DNA-binding transcriptional MocR family regulator
MDTTALLQDAVAEKVAYVPGTSFFANGGGENTMRLNFSYSKQDLINEGIARLGKVFKKKLAKK